MFDIINLIIILRYRKKKNILKEKEKKRYLYERRFTQFISQHFTILYWEIQPQLHWYWPRLWRWCKLKDWLYCLVQNKKKFGFWFIKLFFIYFSPRSTKFPSNVSRPIIMLYFPYRIERKRSLLIRARKKLSNVQENFG